MPEHEPKQQAETAYWEAKFHKLPAAVLTDYLRVFEAAHRHYEGQRIGPGDLRRCFVVIDDTGTLQVQPPDWDLLGNVGWDDLGDPHWRCVDNWARLNPLYRCVGLASGNPYNLSLLYGLYWPWSPVRVTAIDVRVVHRDSTLQERRTTMYRFPITAEGRYRRRIRFEPEQVALVQRWSDTQQDR
ncbi:hypothetical protein [Actinoallomurus sp. NPDC050550]|uniref:hypothetical protein n=1 Tax=Actinoallomurus sp. NPDC050550 TaxID=3154937 RepID=UPI0033ED9A92